MFHNNVISFLSPSVRICEGFNKSNDAKLLQYQEERGCNRFMQYDVRQLGITS